MASEQVDLLHHGDADVMPGLVDLAVNVTSEPMPPWLRDALRSAMGSLAAYPDPAAATAAVAARHARPAAGTLLTSGAAEAFVLLARALRPRHAVVVHPQFTEPEQALVAAGHAVHRVVLAPPFTLSTLSVADIPDTADLVVLGNPTNPTSVLHSSAALRSLARPGRTLVVDEAFMDVVPGETQSLAAALDVPGLVVVRSLTKTWGLAGLRIGYVLAVPEMIGRLRAVQPLWAVSSPALAAATACSDAAALDETARRALTTTQHREHLLAALATVAQVEVVASPAASFVLLHVPTAPDLRSALRAQGFALRRCDTFPGLDDSWLRMAVREPVVTDAVVAAIRRALATQLSP